MEISGDRNGARRYKQQQKNDLQMYNYKENPIALNSSMR